MNQKGSILMLVIIAIALIIMATTEILSISLIEYKIGLLFASSNNAYYIGEAGAEYGLAMLREQVYSAVKEYLQDKESAGEDEEPNLSDYLNPIPRVEQISLDNPFASHIREQHSVNIHFSRHANNIIVRAEGSIQSQKRTIRVVVKLPSNSGEKMTIEEYIQIN